MGCSMGATARALARASVLAQDPHASPAAVRRAMFLRFYGHEFDEAEREKIMEWLERARSRWSPSTTSAMRRRTLGGRARRRTGRRAPDPRRAAGLARRVRVDGGVHRASAGSRSGTSGCTRRRASGWPSRGSSRRRSRWRKELPMGDRPPKAFGVLTGNPFVDWGLSIAAAMAHLDSVEVLTPEAKASLDRVVLDAYQQEGTSTDRP